MSAVVPFLARPVLVFSAILGGAGLAGFSLGWYSRSRATPAVKTGIRFYTEMIPAQVDIYFESNAKNGEPVFSQQDLEGIGEQLKGVVDHVIEAATKETDKQVDECQQATDRLKKSSEKLKNATAELNAELRAQI
jgi:hypothetical protein